MIDKSTAGKKHLEIGQTIGVQAEGPVELLKISGIVKFGSVATHRRRDARGVRPADRAAAVQQARAARRDRDRREAGRVRRRAARSRCARSCRRPPRRGRPRQQAKKDAEDTNAFISFLRGFLLAFGGIALFVGSFVIANSLSITIAQRTREFATLRTLGATRRQVLWSVVIEALVVGTLASIIGLLLGFALAKGLFELFDAVGFTLPNSGLLARAADGRRLARRRDRRHAAREPAAGAARHARAADRGRARGRDAAGVALRPLPHARLGAADRARLRRAPLRACSHRTSARRQVLLWLGTRRAARLLRRVAPLRPLRAAARGGGRLARRPDRRRRRNARARQRAAEPAAHGVDRGRADDRARARDARRRARGRDHGDVPRRRERALGRRRLRGHRRRTTSRRSRSRPRTPPPKAPGVEAVGNVRTGDGAGRSARRSSRPRSIRGTSSIFNVEVEGRLRRPCSRRSATTARSSTTDYAKNHHLQRRLADRPDFRERREQARSWSRASSTRRRAARRSGR